MQTTYELTRQDKRALELFLLKRNYGVFLIAVLMLFIIFYNLITGTIHSDHSSLYWSIAPLIFTVAICYRVIARSRKMKIYGTWSIEVNDDRVICLPPNGNKVSIPWSNLYSVHQSNKHVFILVRASAGFVIPKSSLSPENHASLSEKINTNSAFIGTRFKGVRRKQRRLSKMIVVVLVILVIAGIVKYLTA